MFVSFGFGCTIRQRVFTVNRAALLCGERGSMSAAHQKELWADIARNALNKASRLTLLRANITWTKYVSDFILIEPLDKIGPTSLTVTAFPKGSTLAKMLIF